jgi:hypothetical protein
VGAFTPTVDTLIVKLSAAAAGVKADAVMVLKARAMTETVYHDAGPAWKTDRKRCQPEKVNRKRCQEPFRKRFLTPFPAST